MRGLLKIPFILSSTIAPLVNGILNELFIKPSKLKNNDKAKIECNIELQN